MHKTYTHIPALAMGRRHPGGMLRIILTGVVLAAFLWTLSPGNVLAADAAPPQQTEAVGPGQMPYFDAVNDPIEGFNRCSWALNNWLFRGIIYPLSVGYTTITP